MKTEAMRALVVEDDPAWRQILNEILTDEGFEVDMAGNLETAITAMRSQSHRIAVVDLSLGGTDHHNQDGLGVLIGLSRHDPNCVPILLTGFATVELAVSVMREYGSLTCLRKESFRRADFRLWVDRALAIAPAAARALDSGPGREPRKGRSAGSSNASLGAPAPALVEALVVEDDAGWQSLLTELLAEEGFRVTTCGSYVEALGLLTRTAFALAVIDLSLASSLEPEPNRDGYRLLASSRLAGMATIVVSGFAEPAAIERAYDEYGILTCMEKQAFDRKAFLHTVRGLRKRSTPDQAMESLTAREREVLALLARGLTNKEIAMAIEVSPNTVKRHLKSIYAKLDVNTRAAASARAVSAGLLSS